MATPNSNHSKLGAFCIALSLFFFLGCKKNDVLLFKVAVQCEIPYDHTPIPGVKFKVVEYSSDGDQLFGPSEPTGFEMQGITGTNGRAVVAFTKRRKDTKNRCYQCFFDYSGVQSPYADYTLINTPQFIDVFANEPKEIYLRLLPKMDVQINFKNLNCTGTNDSFKYKIVNINDNYTFSYEDFVNIPWLEGDILNGCVDIQGDITQRLSGKYIYIWQATRNGIVTNSCDTVLVAPNVNNQINIFW
ncbi:MAG: hypothetical protein IT221_00030 [Fluviicola sp.]|nr:hypothetical protein [Fluviicola sp.]